MAVFPEDMNRLNHDDVKKSLTVMENYIRYMKERIEFNFGTSSRRITSGTTVTTDILQQLEQIGSDMAVLGSNLSVIAGEVTGISNYLTSVIDVKLTDIDSAITDLDERVTALENQNP